MIRCLLIDDEQPALNILTRYIQRTPGLQLIGTFTSPHAGMEVIREQLPELVFLDIQMDQLSGTEVARTMDTTSRIVFTTAFTEFAAESYEFGAIDYLVKPITFERFSRAVSKLKLELGRMPAKTETPAQDNFLFIKTGTRGARVKVDLMEIEYVQANNNYVAFHNSKTSMLAYLSLKEVLFRLPPERFMRVHKSFIVALDHIAAFEHSELVMKRSNRRIPVGALYKDFVLNWLTNNMIERLSIKESPVTEQAEPVRSGVIHPYPTAY